MLRTRSWLALLLLLHIVAHPFVHIAVARGTPVSPPGISAGGGNKHLQTEDCQFCRSTRTPVPTTGFAALEVCKLSSAVASYPVLAVYEALRVQPPSRAPPAI